MKMILIAAYFLSMGCFSKTDVLVARLEKSPENINGVMRLAQRKVRVIVEGGDRVGTFTIEQPAAYILIHEGDLSKLIANTKRLQELTNASNRP